MSRIYKIGSTVFDCTFIYWKKLSCYHWAFFINCSNWHEVFVIITDRIICIYLSDSLPTNNLDNTCVCQILNIIFCFSHKTTNKYKTRYSFCKDNQSIDFKPRRIWSNKLISVLAKRCDIIFNDTKKLA